MGRASRENSSVKAQGATEPRIEGDEMSPKVPQSDRTVFRHPEDPSVVLKRLRFQNTTLRTDLWKVYFNRRGATRKERGWILGVGLLNL